MQETDAVPDRDGSPQRKIWQMRIRRLRIHGLRGCPLPVYVLVTGLICFAVFSLAHLLFDLIGWGKDINWDWSHFLPLFIAQEVLYFFPWLEQRKKWLAEKKQAAAADPAGTSQKGEPIAP